MLFIAYQSMFCLEHWAHERSGKRGVVFTCQNSNFSYVFQERIPTNFLFLFLFLFLFGKYLIMLCLFGRPF